MNQFVLTTVYATSIGSPAAAESVEEEPPPAPAGEPEPAEGPGQVEPSVQQVWSELKALRASVERIEAAIAGSEPRDERAQPEVEVADAPATDDGHEGSVPERAKPEKGKPKEAELEKGKWKKAKPSTEWVFIPQVRILADTEKSGKLAVAPGILIGGKRTDWLIAPAFEVALGSGKATFPLDPSSDRPSWRTGGTITIELMNSRQFTNGVGEACAEEDDRPMCRRRQMAIAACEQATNSCSGTVQKTDKPYCDARKANTRPAGRVEWDNLDLQQMCPTGQQVLEENPEVLAKHRYRYPLLQLSGGAMFGFDRHQFLRETEEGPMMETRYEATSSRRTSTNAVLSITSVLPAGRPGLPLTLEVLAFYAHRWKAGSTKVRYCLPKGEIDDGTGIFRPVEQCKEGTLNAPEATNSGLFTVLFGGVDVLADRFRFAAGPSYSVSKRGDDDVKHTVGGQIPIFISTKDRDSGKYLGKYKGVFGVTLFVSGEVGGDDKTGASVGAVFEVLGDASLFGTALNRLK